MHCPVFLRRHAAAGFADRIEARAARRNGSPTRSTRSSSHVTRRVGGFADRIEARAARQGRRVGGFADRIEARAARQGRRVGGFTLIEVLIVVVILGILAGLIVPRIMDEPDKAKVVAAKNDIRTLKSALKLYRLDNGVYPSAEQGLSALVKKPETGDIPRNWKAGGYLERLPKDPWGSEYIYLNPGVHDELDVASLGADRQPGGTGFNADIGSWETE